MLGEKTCGAVSVPLERCPLGLRSGLCADLLSSSIPSSANNVLMDVFVYKIIAMLVQVDVY